MRISATRHGSLSILLRLGAGTGLFLLVAYAAHSSDPQFSLIEFLGTNGVALHFNADANRTYTIQYRDLLPPGSNSAAVATNASLSGTWSNLFVVPTLPFFEHYVIPDWPTNRTRFYRLLAAP